jgi:hypothetical protein
MTTTHCQHSDRRVVAFGSGDRWIICWDCARPLGLEGVLGGGLGKISGPSSPSDHSEGFFARRRTRFNKKSCL